MCGLWFNRSLFSIHILTKNALFTCKHSLSFYFFLYFYKITIFKIYNMTCENSSSITYSSVWQIYIIIIFSYIVIWDVNEFLINLIYIFILKKTLYWQKLLSVRRMVRDKFEWKVGDSSRVFLWYDKWHPLGIHVDYFSC